MRNAIKRAVEASLCGLGFAAHARRRNRDNVLVLAYHNIVPAGEAAVGDTSLHLSQRQFAAQLDLLIRTHDVVALSDLASPARGARPRAVITFDDAYRGALTAGVDELAKRGLPATVFVAPAFVGGGVFWWDAFAGPSGLDAQLRHHALEHLAGSTEAVRAWAAAEGRAAARLPEHAHVADEAEMRTSSETGLIAFGSHTWSHINLTKVDGATARAEMSRPVQWLRDRFGSTVNWISYPYGQHNAEVDAHARACGFDGELLIEGGWIPPARIGEERPLPRRNVPAGISLNGFELLAAGLFQR